MLFADAAQIDLANFIRRTEAREAQLPKCEGSSPAYASHGSLAAVMKSTGMQPLSRESTSERRIAP